MKDEQTTLYDELSKEFDFYIDGEGLPPKHTDSIEYNSINFQIISSCLSNMVNEPVANLHCKNDETWREIFKSSVISFLLANEQLFQKLDQQMQKEIDLLNKFANSNTDNRFQMLSEVKSMLQQKYNEREINIEGYEEQLAQMESPDSAFEAFLEQWQELLTKRAIQNKLSTIQTNKQKFEHNCQQSIQSDYESFCKIESTSNNYPVINEIVQKMGREKENRNELRDTTTINYLPQVLSDSHIVSEIEGVKLGNSIPHVLPSELANLASEQTENLFLQRFATNQLQILQSKPPVQNIKKQESKQTKPRLNQGPIIVSVDTSASMMGKPIKIANATLFQLLKIARRQKRSCFLITYSIRAHAIDLTKPNNWNKVKKFLQSGYTGGTDGNEMLKQACETLNSANYSTADVLIISDFEWSQPANKTIEQIDKNKQLGTRFYGLCINDEKFYATDMKRHEWLNDYWKIKL